MGNGLYKLFVGNAVKINVIVKLLQIASGIQKEHEAASFSLIASFLRIAGIKRWNIRLNTLSFEGLKQNSHRSRDEKFRSFLERSLRDRDLFRISLCAARPLKNGDLN